MSSNHLKSRVMSFVFFGLLFLLKPVVGNAEQNNGVSSSGESRVSFSLGGGYTHSESWNGLVEVNAEIQFNLSSSVRVGFSIGYLSDSESMHMFGNIGGMSGGMMGSQIGGLSETNHDFRVIPFTVNLYYVLPVSSRLDLFMTGGGGYYMSSFRDISTQEKSAFGSHAGFGFDLEVAERIIISGESLYRFVSLGEFVSELHPGFREGMAGGGPEEGFWHYNHSLGEYHFHVSNEDQAQMMTDSPPFNISLNGFSFRAAIKFSF